MKKYIQESQIINSSSSIHKVVVKTLQIEYYEQEIEISDQSYNDLITHNEYSDIYDELETATENAVENIEPDEYDYCYIITDENGQWLDSYNSFENMYEEFHDFMNRK